MVTGHDRITNSEYNSRIRTYGGLRLNTPYLGTLNEKEEMTFSDNYRPRLRKSRSFESKNEDDSVDKFENVISPHRRKVSLARQEHFKDLRILYSMTREAKDGLSNRKSKAFDKPDRFIGRNISFFVIMASTFRPYVYGVCSWN